MLNTVGVSSTRFGVDGDSPLPNLA
jgi:hypothetical protein